MGSQTRPTALLSAGLIVPIHLGCLVDVGYPNGLEVLPNGTALIAYYRSSTDGGQTWSAEVDNSVAVWGETVSFSAGPGGSWFNRMT